MNIFFYRNIVLLNLMKIYILQNLVKYGDQIKTKETYNICL